MSRFHTYRLGHKDKDMLLAFGKKLALILGIFLLLALMTKMAAFELAAQSTPTGTVIPEIFAPTTDDCNLGLIGACNDAGDYVSGPEDVLKTWFFSEAIPWWVSFFIALTSGISVLMMMVGGIFLLVSGDNEELKTKGQKTITWALMGILITLFAFTIVAILENLPLPGSTAEITPPPQ